MEARVATSPENHAAAPVAVRPVDRADKPLLLEEVAEESGGARRGAPRVRLRPLGVGVAVLAGGPLPRGEAWGGEGCTGAEGCTVGEGCTAAEGLAGGASSVGGSVAEL